MPTISKRPARKPSGKESAPRSRGDQLTNTLAFMRLLWAVDHGLRSLSKQMQARIGMTGPQRLALRIVGRFPRMMPSELADLLHLDRGTLTGILERLAAQQLLVREPHQDDGRSVLLRLTARGRLLDRETAGTVEACVRRALASVPRASIDAAKQVLEAVARELAREEGREPDTSDE
jgi:MarR family transcriptional regulator, organic hydroperoxide resistance regulator